MQAPVTHNAITEVKLTYVYEIPATLKITEVKLTSWYGLNRH